MIPLKPHVIAATQFKAAQGDAGAQHNLGFMHEKGWGVVQDYAEAVKWYRLAAAQGRAGAQHQLGLMYENGLGVAQDYVQAHKLYDLAASRYLASEGDRGEEWRDDAIKSRDEVASKMTSAQIAEAQRLAREWKLGSP